MRHESYTCDVCGKELVKAWAEANDHHGVHLCADCLTAFYNWKNDFHRAKEILDACIGYYAKHYVKEKKK